MIVTIEESLEMVGLVVFIWALLYYCADNLGNRAKLAGCP